MNSETNYDDFEFCNFCGGQVDWRVGIDCGCTPQYVTTHDEWIKFQSLLPESFDNLDGDD